MYKVVRIIILFTILTGINSCDSKRTEGKQIIAVEVLPSPNKVLKRGGIITLSSNIWVIANVSDSLSSELATYLVKSLNKITGKDALITDIYSTRKHLESVKIVLDDNLQLTSAEDYTLDITSSHIIIKATSSQGIYYGIQSLLQLLRSGVNNGTYELPKIVIKDSPNFLIRGIAIQGSQLNNISSSEFFHLLSVLKINSVFVIDDKGLDPIIKSLAADNYVKLYAGKELLSTVSLISYGATSKELEDFYRSVELNPKAKGVFLDLTSTTDNEILPKLSVLAELSWSDNKRLDFAKLSMLTKKVLVDH